MQELAELKRQKLAASINVERAIASLDEAKLNYHASTVRTQPFWFPTIKPHYRSTTEQVNNLQLQLDKVNDELETLVSVYLPYRGKVRRVKILEHSDRNINVEVTLDVRGDR